MRHSAELRLHIMPHCAESILKIEYLREYEFIFKTALAHESGDLGVLLAEKNEGRKSRETVPLSAFGPYILHLFIHTYSMCTILLF
jgi:hypothetical protein